MPPVEHYLEQVDWEAVAREILNVREGCPKLPEFDFEDAKKMVAAAAQKWLLQDVLDLEITNIENAFSLSGIGRGVIDLQGRVRGLTRDTADYSGARILFDWKTSKNTLDTKWKDRLIDSWQWRLYARATNAHLVGYRGISRSTLQCRQILIEVPWTNEAEVDRHFRGIAEMRRALVAAQLPVWPQHAPFACGAYGRECVFLADCRSGACPPKPIEYLSELSYSAAERFLLCPELARRTMISDESQDTEETLFGNAVHRGLAALYQQVKTFEA